MQLATASSLVRSSGVVERSQSRVNMNATAFKILSSGLYSDKIGAVLREIGCNAADAHIMAGIPDRPFQVKLPTPLDPTFAIKDWGPGLSHEDVMNNYQTYFHSTKTQSNDVTGCFGLGSKSPYAYTDQFTVKSAHDGVLRIYFCAFDESGVPTTSLVSESPVSDDWPHGIEVSLPVSYGDQNTFQQTAQRVYRWFRVSPTVIGGQQIQEIEYEYTIGRFRKVKDVGYGSQPHLIMGNVAYVFNQRELEDSNNPDWMSSVLHWIYMQDIVFEVPIGTVDITASRETVEYTPRTKAALRQLLIDEVKQLALLTDAFFDANKNLTSGTITELLNTLAPNAELQFLRTFDTAIKAYINSDNVDLFNTVMRGEIEVERWDELVEEKRDTAESVPIGTLWHWDGDRRRSKQFSGSVPLNNKTTVLINDRPPRATDRVRILMAEDKTRSVLVLSTKEPGGWKDIADTFDTNPVPIDYKLISALPKPDKSVRSAGGIVLRRKGDEKELGVWDTATDPQRLPRHGFEPPMMAIKDIPLDSRYYLVREAGGWGRRTIDIDGYQTGCTCPAYYFALLRALKTHGLPCLSHLAIVTQGSIEKLKLESFGFKPYVAWLREVLEKDQRVIDYKSNAKLSVSVQLNTYGQLPITFNLFQLARSGKREWAVVERAIAGTQYLTDLKALVTEYEDATAKARALQKVDPNPWDDTLARIGYAQSPRYESHDFNTKLSALQTQYPKLKAMCSGLIYESGVFDFQLMALAMAVSPNDPVILPTAEET